MVLATSWSARAQSGRDRRLGGGANHSRPRRRLARQRNVYQPESGGKLAPLPIILGHPLGPSTDQVYLILYGTGIRGRSALSNVSVSMGGVKAQVLYAGPQGAFIGEDQVNVLIPRSLAGKGNVPIVLTADGESSNAVNVTIQ